MHVFFSVGEPSGDQHAAHLIQSMRRQVPDLECSGLGGPHMAAAGCRIHYRLTDLAVMGIFQVIPLLWTFIRLIRQTGRILEKERPDLVLLVDFPGFNWWVARKARKLGIPVDYYMPPQIWAWGSWRLKRVRRYVDRVLCGLPFEFEWYRDRGIRAEYVGHPFFDEMAERQLDEGFVATLRNRPDRVVGLLPGSRNQEVQRNFPLMLKAVGELHRRHPDVHFAVACYRPHQMEWCEQMIDQAGLQRAVVCHLSRTPEIIEAADFCYMVSGSVSLEMLARRTPAVVQYQCSWPTYLIGRMVVRIKYMTLPNLIAGRMVLPEFLIVGSGRRKQREVLDALNRWLSEPAALDQTRREFAAMADEIVRPGAIEQASAAILAGFNRRPASRAA